jgi:hypothetical protein
MPSTEVRTQRTPLEQVHDRLQFNVAAYGKAWTEELEDTEFIARPLLDEVERLLRHIHRIDHRAVVPFEDCRRCETLRKGEQ